MTSLREFLDSPAGRWTGIGFTAATVLVLLLVLYWSFGDSEAVASSRDRPFICAQTGRSYSHEVKKGDVMPVYSPHSGENTGYPAELCFWTADGDAKEDPTPVLLNDYVQKPGPTFCPDCNRLVVGHNPRPQPGDAPPPAKNEYKAPNKDSQDDR